MSMCAAAPGPSSQSGGDHEGEPAVTIHGHGRRTAARRGVRLLQAVLALMWLIGAAADVEAASARYGPIHIEVDAPVYAQTAGGYVEYRFAIENRDAERDHQVRLHLPARSHGSGHYIHQMQRRVRVAAGSRVRVSMWQPPLRISGSGVRVSINGEAQRETLSVGIQDHGLNQSRHWRHMNAAVLVGRQVDAAGRDALDELLRDSSGRPSSAVTHPAAGATLSWGVARAHHPIAQWSENWLSYSRFHGLVLEADELAGAPASVREAIWAYVRLGGTLVMIGDVERPQVPEPWDEMSEAETIAGETVRKYGVGFGRCMFVAAETMQRWTDGDREAEARRALGQFLEHGAAAWRGVRGVAEANSAFPVVDHLGVPVRGLLGLMILFAIAIGPMNVLVLSKLNRRLWMLWTVPTIALLFSVAVFGYATFAEGWQAQSRSTGLTLLEETERRASTLGWAGFYAPMTPRNGLRYDRRTELTPQIGSGGWSSNQGQARFVDWTDGQHLSAGWVQARIPAHLAIRRSQTRRERLTFEPDADGTWRMTNGLGADIEKVYVRGDGGELFRAEDVAAGASALLGRVELEAGSDEVRMDLDELYEQDWLASIAGMTLASTEGVGARELRRLMPNTYLAIVAGAPFLEQGLAQGRRVSSESVVYGIMAEPLRDDAAAARTSADQRE